MIGLLGSLLYLEGVGRARGIVSERKAAVGNDERAACGDGKRLCDAAVIHLHPQHRVLLRVLDAAFQLHSATNVLDLLLRYV